jgi:ferredoxin
VERFPPPDFTTHVLPVTTTPPPRSNLLEWLDVAALAAALAGASWLAIRLRRRGALVVLTLASLAYFGFYRKGCICPIGAIQDCALAIFDRSYAIPLTAVAFLLLPLVATLFFGRTFCAAVCPLGAAQDLVLVRPVAVPGWLEQALGVLPYLYLGSAVVLAGLGSAFIICQYDPFVSFFRLAGSLNLLILGACVLAVGMFVGRPYCRFACPYGAVLRPLSRLAKWHVNVTPDECVNCRLCEEACPFGAIDKPAPPPAAGSRSGRRLLAALLLSGPVMIVAGGWLVSLAGDFLAGSHATVRLARRVRLEELHLVAGTTDASSAFRMTGEPTARLYDQAARLQQRFRHGGWLVGGLVGLVVAGRLVAASVRPRRTEYRANRAACLSCGRCFRYCPREHLRLKKRASLGEGA